MIIEETNIECPECLGNGYDLDGQIGRASCRERV